MNIAMCTKTGINLECIKGYSLRGFRRLNSISLDFLKKK
jgi:hypothetical protein